MQHHYAGEALKDQNRCESFWSRALRRAELTAGLSRWGFREQADPL